MGGLVWRIWTWEHLHQSSPIYWSGHVIPQMINEKVGSSMWEVETGLYVTCQGSFALRSKFSLLLVMPVWLRHVRRGGMFGEPLITAPPRRSQNGMFNCIPHHSALINKATACTGGAQCVCVSEWECVCCWVLSNKEHPFLRDYSTGAVSQNRENKLESQEEKSFMSDALITKTSRFPQTRISWLIIWI